MNCAISEKAIIVFAIIGLAAFTTCSGGNNSVSPVSNTPAVTAVAPPISVSVGPQQPFLQAGTSQQFSVVVLNDPANRGVTWSVQEGAPGGAITAAGAF